ncbi:MAG: DNA mismatch repair endonuclease MutL [Clostridiales bacterium]|nr:DNA mismatch repair endonuclease MutL [Clostridiales bacterium]MDY3746893.1 DNA mismatch repair endonuclease MutL [Lachnospiraceae bacterium]
MSAINLLDTDTINKIAAGEVVERPSSVVKELVENAIDAKASAITIEIKEGGTGMIRITDNGTGIEKEDIPTAFLRHSTSKIKSVEDLLSVSSLGFRGEALSSIAAVGQIELVTKTRSALLGVRYLIDGGVEKSCEDIGCPAGTTFIVRNLFYNTPARRKFLKTNMTEAGYISDLVQRLALSHPEISFKFTNNNQTKLHTMGNHQLKDIIYNIFGRDITANILPVSAFNEYIKISGFIGKPVINRGNRSYENYFINGRYIKSNIITKAIEEAYKTFIMVHKYPFTALHLNVNPELIDVNVHPTKMEIRFNNNEEVYRLVYHAVRSALEGRELIPDVGFDSEKELQKKKALEHSQEAKASKNQQHIPEPFEEKRLEAYKSAETAQPVTNIKEQKPFYSQDIKAKEQKSLYRQDIKVKERQPLYSQDIKVKEQQQPDDMPDHINKEHQSADRFDIKTKDDPSADISDTKRKYDPSVDISDTKKKDDSATPALDHAVNKPKQLELFDDRLLTKEARIRHKLIGQVFDTYWIVEYDGKMFIIDQHAAHEKVLYEKLVINYKSRKPASQYLSPPVILSLSLREENIIHTYMDYFKNFGFEIEPFGGNEYAVRAVPMEMYGFYEKDLLIMMIDSLSTDNYTEKEDMIIDRLATSACKAAVKGNHKMSFKEADALIEQLLQAQNPYTCPHGRPTIISMSQYDLERKFKRIQN